MAYEDVIVALISRKYALSRVTHGHCLRYKRPATLKKDYTWYTAGQKFRLRIP